MSNGQAYCPACGQPNSATARYCRNCGQALPGTVATPKKGKQNRAALAIFLIGVVVLLIAAGLLLQPWRWVQTTDSIINTDNQATEPPATVAQEIVSNTATPGETAVAVIQSTSTGTFTPTPSATATIIASSTPMPEPTATIEETSTSSPPPATETPIAAAQVAAFQVSNPPEIDGLLDEWSGMPAYLSSHQVYSNGDWDGSEDLSAVWRLLWDSSNLYIGVMILDDVHVQTQTGNQIFRGDSLEMQIDANLAGDQGVDSLNADDFQLIFSPGDFANLPPSSFRFQGNNLGQMRDANAHRITVSTTRLAGGYTIEAAIPWDDLAVVPQANLVLGLALNVNDNDSPGTAVQEVMVSNVSTRTFGRPSSWGTLTLQATDR